MNVTELREWYKEKGKLYFASIELTQCCNFNCKHCYCTGKGKPYLRAEEYMAIIDRIWETGCLYLHFTGGEILTNPEFEAIYRYAKDKGFVIDLLTNGSLITDKQIALFKELPPQSIAITLYGTNEEEYAVFTGSAGNYHKVVRAMDLLWVHDIPFVLRTVAVQSYKDSLMALKFEKIAEKYGTTFKYDPIVFPQVNGNTGPLSQCLSVEEIIALESMNEQRCSAWQQLINGAGTYTWTCRAGINSLAVDYKGDAHVCGLYRAEPISILDNSMDVVLKHLAVVHERHINIVNSNACSTCLYRKLCKWCPAYAYVYNGNTGEPVQRFCDLAEARVRAFG